MILICARNSHQGLSGDVTEDESVGDEGQEAKDDGYKAVERGPQ